MERDGGEGWRKGMECMYGGVGGGGFRWGVVGGGYPVRLDIDGEKG